MKNITHYIFCSFMLLTLSGYSHSACQELLNFESKKLHSSQVVNFCEKFSGKTLLVVNTASQCGFTPQFKELETLYQKYKDQGLEIIGFPSNDFRQEYQSESKTADVCFKNFGVTFTMLAPSAVTGPSQNLFYQALAKQSGQSPNWNFNKYLVPHDHQTIQYFGSTSQVMGGTLEQAIVKSLNTN